MNNQQYPMQKMAKQLEAQGRFGDTTLVHLNPAEVQGLASLSPTGKLSINPQTGQPEAFLPMLAAWLGSYLGSAGMGTAIAGGLGVSAGVGSAIAGGIGSGLATTAITGDLKRGLASGIMGAGIGSAVSGASAGAAETLASAPVVEGAVSAVPQLAGTASDFSASLLEGYNPESVLTLGADPAMQQAAMLQAGTTAVPPLDLASSLAPQTASQASQLGTDTFGNDLVSGWDGQIPSPSLDLNMTPTEIQAPQLGSDTFGDDLVAGWDGQFPQSDPNFAQRLKAPFQDGGNLGANLMKPTSLLPIATGAGQMAEIDADEEMEKLFKEKEAERNAGIRESYANLQQGYRSAQPTVGGGVSNYRAMMSRYTPRPSLGYSAGGIVGLAKGGEAPPLDLSDYYGEGGAGEGMFTKDKQMSDIQSKVNSGGVMTEAEWLAWSVEQTAIKNQQALDNAPEIEAAAKVEAEAAALQEEIKTRSNIPLGEMTYEDAKFLIENGRYVNKKGLTKTIRNAINRNNIVPLASAAQNDYQSGQYDQSGVYGQTGSVGWNGRTGIDPVAVQANLRGKKKVMPPPDYKAGFEPEFDYFQDEGENNVPDRFRYPFLPERMGSDPYFDPAISVSDYREDFTAGDDRPDFDVDPFAPAPPDGGYSPPTGGPTVPTVPTVPTGPSTPNLPGGSGSSSAGLSLGGGGYGDRAAPSPSYNPVTGKYDHFGGNMGAPPESENPGWKQTLYAGSELGSVYLPKGVSSKDYKDNPNKYQSVPSADGNSRVVLWGGPDSSSSDAPKTAPNTTKSAPAANPTATVPPVNQEALSLGGPLNLDLSGYYGKGGAGAGMFAKDKAASNALAKKQAAPTAPAPTPKPQQPAGKLTLGGYAGGGQIQGDMGPMGMSDEVQLQGDMGPMTIAGGGIAGVGTPFSAPQQQDSPQQEVEMVAMAVLGQIDGSDQIIEAFVKKYGVEVFIQLRNQILQSSSPDAQTQGLIHGQGGGMDDQVPASIGGGQENAAVSPGEYIVPADVVSGLGDGSSDAGAAELDGMLQSVRMARGGTVNQPPATNARDLMPQ